MVETGEFRTLPTRWWLVLTAYVLSLFAFNLGSARTFTGHEGFVAQAAREMLSTGDWLVPRIDGKPWLEKPPLPHWCVAALGALAGGVDEFVARVPSVLAGLAGVLLMTSLAVRWHSPGRGLLTGFILATSFYVVTYARLAEADIYLWALVLGGLWVFARENVAPASGSPWYAGRWLFYLLLGLTQLCKGPMFGAVMILVPCVGFLGLAWFPRPERPAAEGEGFRPIAGMLRCVRPFGWFMHPAILVFLAISLAWPIAILLRYPETATLWWTHTLGRVGGDKVINPGPWWYYAATLPWQLMPWTLLVLPALPSPLRRAWKEPRSPDRFLAAWCGLLFIALSLIKAKHHHYLIYALPPCAFWAADGLMRTKDWAAWFAADLRRIVALLAAGCLALIGVYGLLVELQIPYAGDVALLGGLAILGTGVIALCLRRGQPMPAVLALFACLWLGYGWAHVSISWKSDGYRAETVWLRQLDRLAGPEETVYVLGIEPSRLLLYSPCRLEVHARPREFAAEARTHPNRLVLTSVGHEPMLRKFGTPTLIETMSVEKGAKLDPFRQYALYRMEWKEPRELTSGAKENRRQHP